jgi:hypothetical protein
MAGDYSRLKFFRTRTPVFSEQETEISVYCVGQCVGNRAWLSSLRASAWPGSFPAVISLDSGA